MQGADQDFTSKAVRTGRDIPLRSKSSCATPTLPRRDNESDEEDGPEGDLPPPWTRPVGDRGNRKRGLEVCQAVYKDIICMIGWKDREPEFKIDFKREHTKAERIEGEDGPPPLFAQPILRWLANFLSTQAFRDFGTVDQILSLTPRPGESYRILEWAVDKLDHPVFPEWSAEGPKDKPKSPKSWGTQASAWAVRAGFPAGMGLHTSRREALIKVDDTVGLEEDRKHLIAQRDQLYKQRSQLLMDALETYQQNYSRVSHSGGEQEAKDWRRVQFDRVRHMMPERGRLAFSLSNRAAPRSDIWVAALHDLIALRTDDCRVAYQETLRPSNGCCPTAFCRQEMERIPVAKGGNMSMTAVGVSTTKNMVLPNFASCVARGSPTGKDGKTTANVTSIAEHFRHDAIQSPFATPLPVPDIVQLVFATPCPRRAKE
ncbi:hypothetical protein PG991_009309 [Apiospora marii]|uniref:Uncharacterized protein n=1 Tax=Apiospora marii TaxID=335849 RepID=A0ABR1RLL4_9PEZI